MNKHKSLCGCHQCHYNRLLSMMCNGLITPEELNERYISYTRDVRDTLKVCQKSTGQNEELPKWQPSQSNVVRDSHITRHGELFGQGYQTEDLYEVYPSPTLSPFMRAAKTKAWEELKRLLLDPKWKLNPFNDSAVPLVNESTPHVVDIKEWSLLSKRIKGVHANAAELYGLQENLSRPDFIFKDLSKTEGWKEMKARIDADDAEFEEGETKTSVLTSSGFTSEQADAILKVIEMSIKELKDGE